jgi:cytochrome b561
MVKADRPARYGGLAILLHWLTLLLVILIYLTIELHELIPRENRLRGALEDWHGYLGFVLLPLAIVRLLNVRRKPAPPVTPALSAWQATLTRWMQNYLYVLIICMPLSGWIFFSADGAMINVWAFPLPAIAPENQGLAQLAERIHVLLGLSGYVFITAHALAALFHHYVVRDDILTRILPRFLGR